MQSDEDISNWKKDGLIQSLKINDSNFNNEKEINLDEKEINVNKIKSKSQGELFENKLRSILFPEPIFSQYINELKTKISKPIEFPISNLNDKIEKSSSQVDELNSLIDDKPQYTRYLRNWKKNIAPSKNLSTYISSLRELHLSKLINLIEKIHKNYLYSDLDLYVDNLCFPTHKFILACYAPFIFQKLERSKKNKSTVEKLRLINIDPQSFLVILDYMYTGIAEPNENNFLPVLNTAIHLFMFEFANAWVELFEHRFTNRTAQMLFRSTIARQYEWSDYIQMLNVAIGFDFENLLVSDQFEQIPFELLRDILKLDDIGVSSEVVLYLSVLKWLNYNFKERKIYALELLKLIRFVNMNQNELFACYNPPILTEVIEHPEIKAMMADAFNFIIQNKSIHESKIFIKNLTQFQKPRNYRLSYAYKNHPLQLWCSFNTLNTKCNSSLENKKQEKFKLKTNGSAVIDSKLIQEKNLGSSFDNTTNSSCLSKTFDKQSNIIDNDTNQFSTLESLKSSTSFFDNFECNDVNTEKKNDTNSPWLNQKTKNQNLNDFFGYKFDSNIEKTTLNSHEKKNATLKNLKQKFNSKNTECQCKQVKHISSEQCLKDRAAEIIQRSFQKFRKRKSKNKFDANKKKHSEKRDFLERKKTNESNSQSAIDLKPEFLTKFTDSLENSKETKKKYIDHPLTTLTKNSDKKNILSRNFNSVSKLNSPSEKFFSDNVLLNKNSLFNEKEDKFNKYSTSLNKPELVKKNIENESSNDIKKISEITPSAYKTEKLILYADQVNKDSCGIYICPGAILSDGQLQSWQKLMHFQLNTKYKLPFDSVIVTHGQNLYVVGGMQIKLGYNLSSSKNIYKYTFSNRKFTQISSLKFPRVMHSCVVAGDRLYVICGCKTLNVPVNTVECIHLIPNKNFIINSEIIKLPSYGRFGTTSLYFRNRLWIIGGIAKIDNNFHLLSEIWIYDAQITKKWLKSKFPVPIAYSGCCVVNEEFIYVVGGRCVGLNGKLQPSEKVWCWNLSTKRWQQIASLNQPRCNCCCVLLDNRIYAFGGSLENDLEHLRGSTGEFYDLSNPTLGWQMLNTNLPVFISGQTVSTLSSI